LEINEFESIFVVKKDRKNCRNQLTGCCTCYLLQTKTKSKKWWWCSCLHKL